MRATLLLISVLCSFLSFLIVQGEEEQQHQPQQQHEVEEVDDEDFDEMDFYFYKGMPDAFPSVEEYIAPHEDWNGTCPDFIYEPKKVPGIRIVEFYAHWWCVYYFSRIVSISEAVIFNLPGRPSN
eukprot:scaffold14515_cov97-Cylindrotheca_fusiformis.AAC.1